MLRHLLYVYTVYVFSEEQEVIIPLRMESHQKRQLPEEREGSCL